MMAGLTQTDSIDGSGYLYIHRHLGGLCGFLDRFLTLSSSYVVVFLLRCKKTDADKGAMSLSKMTMRRPRKLMQW